MALNRDAILGASDIETEKVPVPEWGDDVLIRGLTGEERDAYESSRRQIRNFGTPQAEMILVNDNMRANLLVRCIVDEAGNRVFTDGDAGLLGMKNGKVLDRLFDVAARLSGLSDEEAEAMEGNSETPRPDGVSSSSSPEPSAAPEPNSSDASVPVS